MTMSEGNIAELRKQLTCMKADLGMHNIYEITTWANPGIVGEDAEGNPWITWDGPPRTCDECGDMIDRGYARGKMGEQKFYCCSHIKKTDKYKKPYPEQQKNLSEKTGEK